MSVLDTPRNYDRFTLDGDTSPGLSIITNGGDRKIEIMDQGQPLTRGKNTVVRSIENIVITWGFKLGIGTSNAQRQADFTKRDAWIAMLEEGSRRAKPRVYKLNDPRCPWLTRVCLQGFKPQNYIAPGGPWDWELIMHEYNRVKPFGGPLQPTTEQGRKNALLNTEAGALKGIVAAHDAWRAGGGK